MATNSFIDRLRQYLRELRTANGANVTITFALATIPIVGFVGAAVDYSHANSVKAAMQAAVDTTALMLSKDAPTLTDSELQTKANDYFKALFTPAGGARPPGQRDLHDDKRFAGRRQARRAM